MTMIERTSGTRAVAHRPTALDTARAAFAATVRFFKNRMAIKYMVDLDDALLKDIGLTRGDVNRAYLTPVSQDPMQDLKLQASKRSRAMDL